MSRKIANLAITRMASRTSPINNMDKTIPTTGWSTKSHKTSIAAGAGMKVKTNKLKIATVLSITMRCKISSRILRNSKDSSNSRSLKMVSKPTH
jgi:hypothetical protein